MKQLLEAAEYRKWLLHLNGSQKNDGNNGRKWYSKPAEIAFLIPVILTVALYIALIMFFYMASLRARWKHVITYGRLRMIQKAAKVQEQMEEQEHKTITETIENSVTIKRDEPDTTEKKGWRTVMGSDDKEYIIVDEEDLPPSSPFHVQAKAYDFVKQIGVETARKEKPNQSLPSLDLTETSSEDMETNSSFTVSQFSSNKRKDLSSKPELGSICTQVDVDVKGKRSGNEATISGLESNPQKPTSPVNAKGNVSLMANGWNAIAKHDVNSAKKVEQSSRAYEVHPNCGHSVLSQSETGKTGNNEQRKKEAQRSNNPPAPLSSGTRQGEQQKGKRSSQKMNAPSTILNDLTKRVKSQRQIKNTPTPLPLKPTNTDLGKLEKQRYTEKTEINNAKANGLNKRLNIPAEQPQNKSMEMNKLIHPSKNSSASSTS